MQILSNLRLVILPSLLLAVGAPVSAGSFDGCGELVQGVTCPILFQADAGGLYLSDADFPAAGLVVGDRCRIVADLDTGCFSICLQIDGCLYSSSILPDNCTPTSIGQSYCGPAVTNSTGAPGEIHAFGSTAVADDDLTLTASQLPSGEFGYFLCSQVQGFVPMPGGSQGNLCLGSPIGRFSAQVGQVTNGQLSISAGLTAFPMNPAQAVLPGETWNFQCWFRDQNPTTTSNFTDGTSVTFV